MKARWVNLFEDHYTGLRGFFRRRRVQQDDADDLVQEVYARLLRSGVGQGDDHVQDPEAYLYTVAANLSREHAARQQSAAARVVDIADFEHLLTSGDHPETLLEAEQRRRRVQEIMQTLPARTREILVLQCRDGLSYQQIADHLGMTVHAVKKHVSRGLERCRAAAARGAQA